MSDDNVIHIDFARRASARPPESTLSAPPRPDATTSLRTFIPAQPPLESARPGTKDPLGDVYTTREVAKLFGLAESRLRYWEKSDFIVRSVEQGRRRFYSFEDLIGIRAARELLGEGVPLQSVRRSIEALRSSLPRVARPLSALRIVADGSTLLVRDENATYEPATGQLRLDFEVSQLRDDVVRVLRRGEKQSNLALAYQHYLEGCRFDESECTLERAEAAYRRALELNPSLANAITNLGNLMYRRGRLEEAENFYVRALGMDSEQPEAFYNLGFLLYDRGDTSGAVLNFRRALRSDPSFADAHFNLAMALSDLGSRDEARTHWETYLKLDPNSQWAEIARGHLV